MIDHLTDEAIRFLAVATEGGILSYRPREDPLIAELLDAGYLTSRADDDPEYEMLLISGAGTRAVLAVQGKTEDQLPPSPGG